MTPAFEDLHTSDISPLNPVATPDRDLGKAIAALDLRYKIATLFSHCRVMIDGPELDSVH